MHAAIAEQGRLKRLRAPLPTALLGAGAQMFMQLELSPEEAEDIQFRSAWLAFMWGRAAAQGVSVQVTHNCQHSL